MCWASWTVSHLTLSTVYCELILSSGMARIFTAAPGLVKLMNGESWAAVGLPDVYEITEDRLQNLKGASVSKVAVI
jgi:hypothetical protein